MNSESKAEFVLFCRLCLLVAVIAGAWLVSYLIAESPASPLLAPAGLSAHDARSVVAYVDEQEKHYSTSLILRDIHEASIDKEYSLTQELRNAGITPKNRQSAVSQLEALGYEVQIDEQHITISWAE